MNQATLEITDIFKGAYFLCTGGELSGIRVAEHGRRMATFLIRGDNLTSLDKKYRDGHALVNPLNLQAALNHLRDHLFEKLNENGGRHDRKRSHRVHQKLR